MVKKVVVVEIRTYDHNVSKYESSVWSEAGTYTRLV